MYRKTVLDNGLRIVSEEIHHVRSVSIGIWVRCGSRDEDRFTNGTAHFIEHMLFKGTGTRSAYDIASAIDSIGGIVNAYTGKEITSFYMKVPDYHLCRAIEILSDIFNNSLFDPSEIEKEKSVILQEICMIEDTPDEYVYDFFGEIFWNGHPLGLPVLGSRETVSNLDRNGLLGFFNDKYRADHIVVAATGNLKHDDLVKQVENAFSGLKGGGNGVRSKAPTASSRIGVLGRDLEQVHLIMGTLGPSFTDPSRYSAYLMNAVLGGSMSSRLFQEIREKRGLAYSVHSYIVPYEEVGKFGVYVGMSEDKVKDVIGIVLSELDRIRTEYISDKELHTAKEQIKGNFLLGMESTDSRMTRLAKNEIYFGRHFSPEETVENIEAVTREKIRTLAQNLLGSATLSAAAVGRISEEDIVLEPFGHGGLAE
ncbi:MAG: M16 family metallopeptidase [Syntrophales bacterium]